MWRRLPAAACSTAAARRKRIGVRILRRIVARWVGWGIVLIFIASALRMGVTRRAFRTLACQDVHPAVIAVIIMYFLCGLLLLSQGQLAALRARWTIDRLPTSSSILRNWPIDTVVVLVATAMLALFCPGGHTADFASLGSASRRAILSCLYLPVDQPAVDPVVFFAATFAEPSTSRSNPRSHGCPAANPPAGRDPVMVGRGAILDDNPVCFGPGRLLLLYGQADQFSLAANAARYVTRALAAAWTGWNAWRRSQQLRDGAILGSAIAEAGARRRWWSLRWGGLNPEQQVRYLYFQLLHRAAEYDELVARKRDPCRLCTAPERRSRCSRGR